MKEHRPLTEHTNTVKRTLKKQHTETQGDTINLSGEEMHTLIRNAEATLGKIEIPDTANVMWDPNEFSIKSIDAQKGEVVFKKLNAKKERVVKIERIYRVYTGYTEKQFGIFVDGLLVTLRKTVHSTFLFIERLKENNLEDSFTIKDKEYWKQELEKEEDK